MTRKRKPELTKPNELCEYFKEHVRYEAAMLCSTSDLLAIPFAAPSRQLADVLRFAVIESFASHSRNLIDFFYPRDTVRDGDVIAADYFPGGLLPTGFPAITPTLQRARERADKETAHLTTARISGAPPEKEWPVRNISTELRELLRTFVAKVKAAHPDLMYD